MVGVAKVVDFITKGRACMVGVAKVLDSIGFQTLLRTMYVPSLVKIHGSMLILEWSQGCYGRTDRRKDRRTVALLYPFATSLARG
jgi:hypothetical protein